MLATLALLLPLLPGLPLLMALQGRPRDFAGVAYLLGCAWLLGAALLALLLHAFTQAAPAGLFAAALPALAAVSLLAGVALWFRRHARMPAAPPGRLGWVGWLALVLVALHLLLAAHQALVLPTLPWDAWTTWVGRARAWWGADSLAPFVGHVQWLQEGGGARATLAPHYPEALPRLLLWSMSAHGSWSEAVAHAWWPLLALSISLSAHGLLRRFDASPRLSAIGVFAVLSLPLLNSHVALAGYADLWLAALVAVATLHLALWLRDRRRADLVVGLVLVALMPLFKLEGAVWMLLVLAGATWALLSPRWRLWLPLAGLLVLGAIAAFGQLLLPLPGLGVVELAWGRAVIPGVGVLELYWRPVGDQVASALLALPNWHLLAWVVPPLLVLAARRWWRAPELRLPAAVLLLGLAFLFVLFFFTDASAWAENLTSVNRVLLHLAPLAALWMVLMLRGLDAALGRGADQPSAAAAASTSS